MSLRFIALSGTTSVTHNLYVYETPGEMMIVDCGVGFPDIDMPGVELVIPDFSYIKRNKHKLTGILLSQAHEDHQGALPFLFEDVQAPVYSTKLVSEFVRDKFDEAGIKVDLRVFNPEQDSFNIGVFTIHPFRVSHSVPDTVGFAIDTPEGRAFHVPEHKFDPDPVDGHKFDVERAKSLASEGVLFLASDCLGANRPGTTPSERSIEENLFKVARQAEGSIFFTTISSNIGRIQQSVNVAKRLGRKVSFIGHSIRRKAEIANQLGYLSYGREQVVELRQTRKLRRKDVFYVIAGCYGQEGSSLFKVALDEHPKIWAEKGDMMIFSADPAPPYTKESEDFIIDKLIDKGVDVHYYDLEEGLYVSGHGSQDDIVRLFEIARPKHFIPVGGTIRFMHSYKKLVRKFMAKQGHVYALKPGESVVFEKGGVKVGKKIPVRDVLVHGTGIGDIGRVVLGDRGILGKEGFVVAVVKVVKKDGSVVGNPQIVSRGFVFGKKHKLILDSASGSLGKKLRSGRRKDGRKLREATQNHLEDYFFKKLARRPMVLPVVVEI